MTKETFINTLELLKRQQNLNCGLAQELQITLRRAFPDVYDWILWWLAKPDNFAIWTDDEPQRWNLGDAGSLYNFISGAAVRDPALRGNDMSMLFLVVSQELYEQLKDHALETGLNLQELMLIILKWLLKHPGQNPAYHTHGYWGCLNTAYQNRPTVCAVGGQSSSFFILSPVRPPGSKAAARLATL